MTNRKRGIEYIHSKLSMLDNNSLNNYKDSYSFNIDFAQKLANSSLVPTSYQGKPDDILVCLQYGAEIGLKPLQALKNISVINGRTCLWGDALLALIQGHPDFEDIIETQSDEMATCIIKRKGRTKVTATFSIEDAKRARLYGKQGPWTTYPKRMLQMRARAFAIRDSFADALQGFSVREEVEDMEEEIINPEVTKAPDLEAPKSRIDFIKDTIEADEKEDDSTVQHDLINLVALHEIDIEVYGKWIEKAGVSSLLELNDEQALKCIEHISVSAGMIKPSLD